MLRTRTRSSVTEVGRVSGRMFTPAPTPPEDHVLTSTQTQTTIDENNGFVWKEPSIGKNDVGSYFNSTSRRAVIHLSSADTTERLDHPSLPYYYIISGPRVPGSLWKTFGGYPAYPAEPSANDTNGWGTTCVNRTIPTSPMWNAAQFIGELHEGLPSVPLKGLLKGRSTQDIGGEYLNYQFGITPFISDFGDAKKAVLGADERLKWLEANSGKQLRRRITLFDEKQRSSGTEAMESYYPLFPLTWKNSAPRNQVLVKSTITSERKVWFSGCYTYYFKRSGNPIAARLQEAAKIYGIEPSASTAWELTPWSWLIDWHANVGEVLENLTRFASDGLVLRWGYIMCHQTVTKEISWPGGSATLISERKFRRAAYPFGFSINPPNYNVRQMAILGALGLTKGPKFSL